MASAQRRALKADTVADTSFLKNILNSGKKPKTPRRARTVDDDINSSVANLSSQFNSVGLERQASCSLRGERKENIGDAGDQLDAAFGQLDLSSAPTSAPASMGERPGAQVPMSMSMDQCVEDQYLLPAGANLTVPASANVFGTSLFIPAWLWVSVGTHLL